MTKTALGFNTSPRQRNSRRYGTHSATENRIALSGSLTADAHKASPIGTGETGVGTWQPQPQRTITGGQP